MVLFGLRHRGASDKSVKAAAKAPLDLQRGNGGWAPSPYLPSHTKVRAVSTNERPTSVPMRDATMQPVS
jgi:hypothetical protein